MCPPSSLSTKKSSTKKLEVGISVSFEDLSYSVPIPKHEPFTILKGLNGSFVPGKLTALMGPSGSGKSTLLDTLAGRKNSGSSTGQVLYNGTPPTQEDSRFTTGYVEQFDTLVGELTVENMLRYTAELKLPSDTPAEEREARVEEVINMLGLESCRSTVIGSSLMRGISGGQAKRVNIGLALITRPPVLFLDEPTSGLDSRTANEVVELLRALAHDSNRTVVCTIHSPTGHAFSLFDNLYMIHNGETIFDGAVPAAQAYFETHGHVRDPEASLPEWLVDLTSDLESIQNRKKLQVGGTEIMDDDDDGKAIKNESSTFVDLFQSSEMKLVASQSRKDLMQAHKDDENKNASIKNRKEDQYPSEWSKLITLLRYRSVAHYQDGEFLGTRFGDKLVFALLILSLYYGIGEETDPQSVASTTTLLFFISALCGYGAAAFVPALNLERKLFYRELADGCYHPATYYLSKFIEEAFIALFTSGVFSVIVFFGLKLTGNFGIFFVSYYLTTLIGVILAYAVAAAVPSL
jgi:ABC-type multidrug transport system ATPase subunit